LDAPLELPGKRIRCRTWSIAENYVGIDPHKKSIVLCVMNQDSRTPARLSPDVVGRINIGGLMAMVSHFVSFRQVRKK
jgi:hypothetical protein